MHIAITTSSRPTVRRLRRAAHDMLAYVPRLLMGTVTRVSTRDPVVALTFDDGPDPRWTPLLLDLLSQYGAHATFFVLGSAAQQYPELIERMRRGGHAIGCHSWDHVAYTAVGARERHRQLSACSNLPFLREHKLFRPPYGCQNLRSRLQLLLGGWRVVTWDVSGRDWRADSAEAIAARIETGLRPGSIVLLHDTLHDVERAEYATRAPTLGAVELLLQRLCDTYRFVTVPELLDSGKPRRVIWRFDVGQQYLSRLQRNVDSNSISGRFNDDYSTTALQRAHDPQSPA